MDKATCAALKAWDGWADVAGTLVFAGILAALWTLL
jgi:hypothetical protein